MKETVIDTHKILFAGLSSGLALCGGIAVAQSYEGKLMQMSQPIALINQSAKLHRVIDEELRVACYVLSDGRTAPSCVSIQTGAVK